MWPFFMRIPWAIFGAVSVVFLSSLAPSGCVLLRDMSGQRTQVLRLSSTALRAFRPTDIVAQATPQPPCGTEPVPPFPDLGQPDAVKSWSIVELGRDWKPPACTDWSEVGFTSLITIAARCRHTTGANGWLQQIGAISQLRGLHYWSTTHKRWRILIVDAYALTERSGQRREDFSSDEVQARNVMYFNQADNLAGKAIFRIRILEASENRIVFDVENTDTIRYRFVPIFHPGELQSIYFLDHESRNVWRFYSILRVGKNANRLLAGNESSSINRAVALYRHFVEIPDTQEPPGAR
jgi:hypothetical protein